MPLREHCSWKSLQGGPGGRRGQQGHLSEGHFASMADAATIVPVCVIKTVCRGQTWRWKGLRRSTSFPKRDYRGILTGFEIPLKVLHPLCVLHLTSVHWGMASEPVMSKPRFAPLACPVLARRAIGWGVGTATVSTWLRDHPGHRPLQPAQLGAGWSKRWERGGGDKGVESYQPGWLSAPSPAR